MKRFVAILALVLVANLSRASEALPFNITYLNMTSLPVVCQNISPVIGATMGFFCPNKLSYLYNTQDLIKNATSNT